MTTLGLRDLGFVAAGQQAASDPNFSSVSLLLHGNGTNGSTTITDSSSSPKTLTAFGDAQISTAQAKFGVASIAFDGNGDYLASPVSSAFEFGTGDFTVECWAFFNNTNAQPMITLGRGAVGGSIFSAWSLLFLSNRLYWYRFGAGNAEVSVDAAWTPNVNTWYHIAASRSSGTIRLFVDGTSLLSTSSTTAYDRVNSDDLRLGRQESGGGNRFVNGYIDELRITKGVARYTANFTLPTAPFPDS